MCLSNRWIYECCGAIMTFRRSVRVCVYAVPIAMQTFDIRALNILPDLCLPVPVISPPSYNTKICATLFPIIDLTAMLVCYKF